MSFRTIVVTGKGKLSYQNDYLMIRKESIVSIHLSEINTILIDSTEFIITTFLIEQLEKWNIKLIFCDSRHNPISEVVPYFGAHNSSKKIKEQLSWEENSKGFLWTKIVCQKIKNQAVLLKKYNLENYALLFKYLEEIEFNDSTNREGHSAKVYFNSLFGKQFTRDGICNANSILDYGYTVLLSAFNRQIVSKGILTQLGIFHKNEFNYFNLSCDLIEPFRVIIDEYAFLNHSKQFDKNTKREIVDLLNKKINYNGKEYFLTNAVESYVGNVTNYLCDNKKELILYEYE